MFFKLWTRAPLTTILPAIRPLLAFQTFELLFDDGAIFFQLLSRLRLEAMQQGGLSIGRPNKPPTLGELDPDTIHVDDIIVLAEIFFGLLCDDIFLVIRAIDSDLRRRYTLGQIRQ